MNREEQIEKLQDEWDNSPRWRTIERTYTPEEVVRLRGTIQVEHTIARHGAEKLWRPGQPGGAICARLAR